ncbi:MAG: hypothetical protein EOP06_06980 [Proteobacteria bacterium]|nr:MAG: hypothetical protein EOP06_06980 [Pseudomonadota bacterium]
MKPLTFDAWRDGTYLPLTEILLVLGKYTIDLSWSLEIGDIAPEPGASALEARAKSGQPMSTVEMLDYFSPSLQIIDGTMEGTDSKGNKVVTIKAVDSTSWDISTTLEGINRELKERFSAKEIE